MATFKNYKNLTPLPPTPQEKGGKRKKGEGEGGGGNSAITELNTDNLSKRKYNYYGYH